MDTPMKNIIFLLFLSPAAFAANIPLGDEMCRLASRTVILNSCMEFVRSEEARHLTDVQLAVRVCSKFMGTAESASANISTCYLRASKWYDFGTYMREKSNQCEQNNRSSYKTLASCLQNLYATESED